MLVSHLDRDAQPIARQVSAGLAKISLALRSQAWREAGTHRISPAQGQVLALLSSHPKPPATLTVIADGLGITPATASETVRALVKKGLVRKVRSAADAREVCISLSTKGRQKAERAAAWSDFLTSAAESLTPLEQEFLLLALTKIIRTLQEGKAIDVARMCVTCRHFRPNVHQDREQPHHCALLDIPFGNRLLRIDCPDYEPATAEEQERHANDLVETRTRNADE